MSAMGEVGTNIFEEHMEMEGLAQLGTGLGHRHGGGKGHVVRPP